MSNIYLTSKQRLKIKKAIKLLDEVRNEIQQANSDATVNWYLEDCGNLNLLDGDSHDAYNDQGGANHDAVIEVFDLPFSGGGGW